MIQIIGIALAGGLIALVIKNHSPEQGLMLSLGVTAAIVLTAAMAAKPVVDYINQLARSAGLDAEIFAPLLKVAAIGVFARIAAETCRDCKENGIAAAVDISGAVMALAAAMPLFDGVIHLLKEFL